MSVIEIHDHPSFDGSEGLLALIIRPGSDYLKEMGAKFLTAPEHEQQVSISVYAKNHIIKPHYHPQRERKLKSTGEVIILREGSMLVDIFATRGEWINQWLLIAGDIIVLVSGGHGFTMIEPVELIEVKTGPYLGDDKVYFKETY